MGSNMQRQAVPLLVPEAPDCRHRHGIQGRPRLRRGASWPRRTAWWTRCSGDEIIITGSPTASCDRYHLIKFARSNQGTCINQRPIVSAGREGGKGRPGAGRRPLHGEGRDRPGPQRPDRLHDLGRLQLRGRRSHQRKAGEGGRVSPPSTSRSTSPRPGIPSWGRRRSPATFPTSATTRSRTWTRAASSASARRCAPAISWWAR